MEISNPTQEVSYIIASGGEKLQLTILDIGDWNMDADIVCAVTHSLGSNWKNVRVIQAILRNDADDGYFDLGICLDAADPSLIGGGIAGISSVQVTLTRRSGGYFDNANFDSTSYNRGWVLVWYTI